MAGVCPGAQASPPAAKYLNKGDLEGLEGLGRTPITMVSCVSMRCMEAW